MSFFFALAALVAAEADGASTILQLLIKVVYKSGYFFFSATTVFFICSFSSLSASLNSADLFLTWVAAGADFIAGLKEIVYGSGNAFSDSSVMPNYSKVALLATAKVKGFFEEGLHRQRQCLQSVVK